MEQVIEFDLLGDFRGIFVGLQAEGCNKNELDTFVYLRFALECKQAVLEFVVFSFVYHIRCWSKFHFAHIDYTVCTVKDQVDLRGRGLQLTTPLVIIDTYTADAKAMFDLSNVLHYYPFKRQPLPREQDRCTTILAEELFFLTDKRISLSQS